jgi:hypothetical protein
MYTKISSCSWVGLAEFPLVPVHQLIMQISAGFYDLGQD